jgi:hypothetical protein
VVPYQQLLVHQSLVQVAEAVADSTQKDLAVRVAAEMVLQSQIVPLEPSTQVVVVAVVITLLVRQAALASSLSNTKYPLKQYLHLLLLQTGRLL